MSARYKNPLKQWCYDNRVSQRQFLIKGGFATSLNKRLFTEDPALLKNTTIDLLARVQSLTKVDLAGWYAESVYGKTPTERSEVSVTPHVENVPAPEPDTGKALMNALADSLK